MNTVLKYVIGLDLLNCHAKFPGDTISRSRENDVWSCYFWKFSGYSRTKIVTSAVAYGRPNVTLSRGTSCRVTVLVLFVSVKPEARRSFEFNLQLRTRAQIIIKSIPTTHCHLSSSLKHPLLAMTRIASGVNACCYQPCSMWRQKRRTMPNVSPSHWTILFSPITLLSLHVLRSGFFFHIILYEHSNHIELNCINYTSTLT